MSASEHGRGCLHCGSPVLHAWAPEGFCCAGCAQVHRLILDCGLGKFYELRPEVTAPVDQAALSSDDFGWLEDARRDCEERGAFTLRTSLRGLSCVACVWLVEKLLKETPGVTAARVNAHRATLTLEWRPGADLRDAARAIVRFGYLPVPDDGRPAGEDDGLTLRMGLAAAFAMNAMLNSVPGYLGMRSDEAFAGVFRTLAAAFATLSMLTGGSYFIARAWAGLRARRLHMDLPIALGLVAAYLTAFVGWALGRPDLEYWDFVSLFTFLMLVGRWTQQRAIAANRRRLPPTAPTVREVLVTDKSGAQSRRAVEGIAPGETYALPPGQVAPLCGRLLEGPAEFSLAWISGESDPRTFHAGQLVPSGALNLSPGDLRLKAAERWDGSMLRRLTEAGGEGSFSPKLLESTLGAYLAAVLAVGAAGFAARLWLGHGWADSLQSLISVLVVSCPCAIGLAFPLATELCVGALRRSGVYVKDEAVWERTLRIGRVAFDKTGTLTMERPELTDPESLEALDAEARSALLALTEGNLHPCGRSLRESLARYRDLTATEGEIVSVPGSGMRLIGPSGVWTLGRPGWAADSERQSDGVELAHDGRTIALFTFREAPRPGAREEIGWLRGQGMEVAVISGDSPDKVTALLRSLGLPDAAGTAAMSPEAKARWVRDHDGASTLVVGDGANDALAFSEAALRGTPVVDIGLLEQKADFHLLGRGLGGIRRLIEVARLRRRVLTEVFLFTLVYNGATIGLSLAGRMSPLLATVLMPTSAVLLSLHVTWRLRKA